jgi:hypothetical protein
MAWFLGLIVVVLCILLGVAIFFLIRFASYIMVVEDTLSEAVDIFNRSKDSMDAMVNHVWVTDSPEARQLLNECLDDVKTCKFATQKVIDNFTRLSKRKYIQVEEIKFELGTREEEE